MKASEWRGFVRRQAGMIDGRPPRRLPADDFGQFFRPFPRGRIDDAGAGGCAGIARAVRSFRGRSAGRDLIEEVFAGETGDEHLGVVTNWLKLTCCLRSLG